MWVWNVLKPSEKHVDRLKTEIRYLMIIKTYQEFISWLFSLCQSLNFHVISDLIDLIPCKVSFQTRLISLICLFKKLNGGKNVEKDGGVSGLFVCWQDVSSSLSPLLHTFPRRSSTCLLVTLPSVVFPPVGSCSLFPLTRTFTLFLFFCTDETPFPPHSPLRSQSHFVFSD